MSGFRMPHKCHGNGGNCPSRSHPTIWELPINELDRRDDPDFDENLTGCHLVSSCSNIYQKEQFRRLLQHNFDRHYNSNKVSSRDTVVIRKTGRPKIDLWLAKAPFSMTQWLNVRGVPENLGNSLYDGHWNFPFWTKGCWENGDKRFLLVFWNHEQNQLLCTDHPTKN